MKTIKERAEESCMILHYGYAGSFNEIIKNLQAGYIRGATEQRDIDAERAVEVHCKLCGGLEGYCDICPDPEKIRQLMKEDKI